MKPALNPTNEFEDYVFLSRFGINDYNFERGDVVSIISPKDPKQRLIKRIIGVPGIQSIPGAFQLHVNVIYDFCFIHAGDVVATNGYSEPFVRIPKGHCWVEGDNTG